MKTLPSGTILLPSTKRKNQSPKSFNNQLYQIHMKKKIMMKKRKIIIEGYQRKTRESNNQRWVTGEERLIGRQTRQKFN